MTCSLLPWILDGLSQNPVCSLPSTDLREVDNSTPWSLGPCLLSAFTDA
jgi:hypothetical protein